MSKITAEVGPTVTLTRSFLRRVLHQQDKNLEDDIALSLAALGIRIIAPIPGKGTIGIEVPNSNPDVVSMRTLIASDKFQNWMPPSIAWARPSATRPTSSTWRNAHLLMAGATGQGKSVGGTPCS